MFGSALTQGDEFMKKIALMLMVLSVGCASGNCRQVASASTVATPASSPTPTLAQAAAAATPAAAAKNKPESTVVVYKYDGTLQCQMGKEITLDVMQRELKGISVIKKEKRHDGLMRTQVCGQGTGQANTYTIPAQRLGDAEKLGFKRWAF